MKYGLFIHLNLYLRHNIKVLYLQGERERRRTLFFIWILNFLMIVGDVYRATKRLDIDENMLFDWISHYSMTHIYTSLEKKFSNRVFNFSIRFRLSSGSIHALILVKMKLHYKVRQIFFFELILFRYLYFSFPIFLVLCIIRVIFSLHLIVMHSLHPLAIERLWSIWKSIVDNSLYISLSETISFFVVVDQKPYHLKVNSILFVQHSHLMVHFFLLLTKVRIRLFRSENSSCIFIAGRGYLYNVKCRTLIGIHRFGHDVHTIKFSPDSK